nr:hypothetical protein [Parabacteroides goldsteinii]
MRELIILCFTILFLPLSVAAGGADLTVVGGALGTDYTYDGNTYTILKNTPLTISGTTTTDNIVVGENVAANITIDGISINLSNVDGKSAIDLKENATLNLTLANASTLISGKAVAGMHLSDGSCLTITEESDGHSLTVTGGDNTKDRDYAGIGIGRNPKEKGNATLKIEGGDVTANGGKATGYYGISGDGIGKNVEEGLSHLTIEISGGSVVANGGDIPLYGGYGGNGINDIVHIKGGDVTAKGKGHGVDITGNVTVEGGTITDCTFKGEVIIKGGTFTNCTLNKIISFDETNASFSDCNLTFTNPATLTKDYSGCTFNGETTIKSGTFTNCTLNKIISFDETNASFSDCNLTFTNPATLTKDYSDCTFNGETTIKSGTFTNCTFTGESFLMNKGTINNTDGSNITAKNITINGGDVTITMPDSNDNNAIGNNDCTVTITGGTINVAAKVKKENKDPSGAGIAGTITIKGGHITATASGKNGAGIGGYGGYGGGTSDKNDTKSNKPITITGGTIIASGGSVGIGSGPGVLSQLITITGGTITARGTYPETYPVGIGSGRENGSSEGLIITGGNIKSTFKDNIKNDNDEDIYLGITPEIKNITDVSVDNKPYYINQNHTDDNKLYLYMTGDNHTVTVRISDGKVTTYQATYESGGVDSDGAGKGYFKFDNGSSSTPSDNSSVALVLSASEMIYGTDKLTVTLTVKNKATKTRSAAMNSVQLALTDEENNVLLSDWKDVTKNGEYEFEFDTKKLNAGTYTLTAQYGGSSESLISSEVSTDLVIKKANPTYTAPSDLKATYGQTLADVTLPSGWTWDNPSESVGNAGASYNFTATFTPADTRNYNTVQDNLSVKVNRADLQASDFTFTAPNDLTYDDNNKTAIVEAKAGMIGVGVITIKYYTNNTPANEAKGPGTYTVKIDVAEGSNYNEATDLTNSGWTFTIIKKQHNITIASPMENGKVTADKIAAIEGETVTLTVSPDKGYELESLSCKQSNGTSVSITNKTFIMPESDVTVTATFKKATVTPPDPVDPTPPVDPDPSPVYYTVTLPAVEGATTDPSAGSHKVKKSDDFSFSLIVQEGYQKNSVPVVTARGEVITPRVSDGKYILPDVRNDVDIEIAGIVPDDDTANVPLPSGFRITATDGILRITAPYATRLYLIDTSGRLILARPLPTGDTRIEGLAAGAYIVTLEGQKGKKILLK